MIEWAKAETSDLYRFGKWLYWAEEWATFKIMTGSEMKGAWQIALQDVLSEQDKVRDALHARKCPYTSRGPSL